MNETQKAEVIEALKKGKVWTVKLQCGTSYRIKGQTIFKKGWFYTIKGNCQNLLGLHIAAFDSDSRKEYNRKFPDNPIRCTRNFNDIKKQWNK